MNNKQLETIQSCIQFLEMAKGFPFIKSGDSKFFDNHILILEDIIKNNQK